MWQILLDVVTCTAIPRGMARIDSRTPAYVQIQEYPTPTVSPAELLYESWPCLYVVFTTHEYDIFDPHLVKKSHV